MSAATMPNQMSDATELPSGAVAAAWSWNVVQRNAPGAISAIAFIVAPVNPSVGFTPVPVVSCAMGCTSCGAGEQATCLGAAVQKASNDGRQPRTPACEMGSA